MPVEINQQKFAQLDEVQTTSSKHSATTDPNDKFHQEREKYKAEKLARQREAIRNKRK